MSEIMGAISEEVRQFADNSRNDIYRHISRTAIVNMYGSEIEIDQTRYLDQFETQQVFDNGPESLASEDWFNDVELIKHFGSESRAFSYKSLSLDATYPMEYFEEEPVNGSFVIIGDEKRWQDQYGSVSGFGSDNEITLWTPSFVAEGSREVTRLHYPDDPTALEQYNNRYRQYLNTLNESDPTICYYRGWDRVFQGSNTPQEIIGGLSLTGIAINDVIKQGKPPAEYESSMSRVVLKYEPEQNGYVAREVVIVDGKEATTEPFWDGEHEAGPPSDELLGITLELVKTLRSNS